MTAHPGAEMSVLPWPERENYQRRDRNGTPTWSRNGEAQYERARAEAALSRLRPALKMLEALAGECGECAGSGTEYYRGYGNEQIAGSCGQCADIRVVIEQIGPLPPRMEER